MSFASLRYVCVKLVVNRGLTLQKSLTSVTHMLCSAVPYSSWRSAWKRALKYAVLLWLMVLVLDLVANHVLSGSELQHRAKVLRTVLIAFVLCVFFLR